MGAEYIFRCFKMEISVGPGAEENFYRVLDVRLFDVINYIHDLVPQSDLNEIVLITLDGVRASVDCAKMAASVQNPLMDGER